MPGARRWQLPAAAVPAVAPWLTPRRAAAHPLGVAAPSRSLQLAVPVIRVVADRSSFDCVVVRVAVVVVPSLNFPEFFQFLCFFSTFFLIVPPPVFLRVSLSFFFFLSFFQFSDLEKRSCSPKASLEPLAAISPGDRAKASLRQVLNF